jgi:pyruvate-formate lyase-activating enzyme
MARKRHRSGLGLIESGKNILDIKITHECNNLCRFCVAGDSRLIAEDLSGDEIKKRLSDNAPSCDGIVFTGGEPTVRADLPELVRYAQEKCGYKTIIIQTNGRRLAYKSYLEELIDSGAGQFSVSIHGHIAELHEYLTQTKDSFAQTLLAIRNIIECGAMLATNTVITKSNCRNLEDIASLLCSLGVKQMQFAYPHIDGKALVNADSIAPPMSIAMPYVCRAVEVAGRHGALAFTEGFPHCMLGVYKDHAVENIHTKRKTIDFLGDIEDFHGHRMNRLKKKGVICSDCSLTQICEGPWADYIERFSWKEFKPQP